MTGQRERSFAEIALSEDHSLYPDPERLATLCKLDIVDIQRARFAGLQLERIYAQFGTPIPPEDKELLFLHRLSRTHRVPQEKLAALFVVNPAGDLVALSHFLAGVDRPREYRWDTERDVYKRIIEGPSGLDYRKQTPYVIIEEELGKGNFVSQDIADESGISIFDFEVVRAHFIVETRLLPNSHQKFQRAIHLGLSGVELTQVLGSRAFSLAVKYIVELGYTTEQAAAILHASKTEITEVRSHLIATGELETTRKRDNPVIDMFSPEEARSLTNEIRRLKWEAVSEDRIIEILDIPRWFLEITITRLKADGELDYIELGNRRVTQEKYDQVVVEVIRLRSSPNPPTIEQIAKILGLSEPAVRKLMYTRLSRDQVPRILSVSEDLNDLHDAITRVDPTDFHAIQGLLDRLTYGYLEKYSGDENWKLTRLSDILARDFKLKPHGLAPFMSALRSMDNPIPVGFIARKNRSRTTGIYLVLSEHVELILETLLNLPQLTKYRR